ncbi:uncharacterized protein LOC134258596 [Saccostrea cucullata]|uniref:uncharacterized protein LOC134258596 n=1 Tax=Saccostrea cuccullata TaxID=36930 RepID=UPI002ED61E16
MKLLVAITCVLAISGLVLADWMHPHYSFRCRESVGIDIFGIHINSRVTILNATCNNTLLQQHNGIFNISYACTKEVKEGNTTAREVEISVIDPIFDGSTTTTAPTTTKATNATTKAPLFIGGHKEHRFTLRCLKIPDTGVNKTVAHVFHGGPHKLPDNHKEVFPVEMRFKATENIKAPDISEIYIGDEFFMFLIYTGVSKYKVIPNSCTAYAGTVVPGKSDKQVPLWDETNKNGNGCNVQKELLDSINPYNNKNNTIAAKMYGFKFEESNFITISCEVGVFPENSLKKICTSTRRRRDTRLGRRNLVDTAIQRKNVVGKLRVVDHPSEYKNMASKTGSKLGSFECVKLSLGIMMLLLLFSIFK